MKIVVDENIPFAKEAFGTLGEVVLRPGRELSAAGVKDATALIVRSVTQVNAALLEGSAIQFVGTATAGVNHIDLDYLDKSRILFASAAGANANSVAEYVVTALLRVAESRGEILQGKSLGVVGVGHVGSLVAEKAALLGLEVILNDPPLARVSGSARYRSLREACEADFVTLHVPLSDSGPDKTHLLFDEKRLSGLSPTCTLINSARGEVIDNMALFQSVSAKKLLAPILDVWAEEPQINWDLFDVAEMGTPHIAGYSFDGKLKGLQMVYEAFCAALGTLPLWRIDSVLADASPKASESLSVDVVGRSEQAVLSEICGSAYDLEGDIERMNMLRDVPKKQRAAGFDVLRKSYPRRLEFSNTAISLSGASSALESQIRGLGFPL